MLEPDADGDGLTAAIGSGGSYALSAARALIRHSTLTAPEIAQAAMQVAAEICVFTNAELTIEEL